MMTTPNSTTGPAGSDIAFPRGIFLFTAIGVFLFMVAQFFAALYSNINWDEFYFLSHVYRFQSGEMNNAFQTFHVNLFGWLTAVPGTEADQIVVARMLMLVLEMITIWLLYLITLRFYPPRYAVFVVLAYIASGFMAGHAVSFRADPIITCLLMTSLYCMLQSSRSAIWLMIAATLAAVAVLVSVKSLFYLPAFACVALYSLRGAKNRVREFARLSATALGMLAIAAVLYWWFLMQLPMTEVAHTASEAGHALDKTVLSQNLFPRQIDILRWAILGYPTVLLLLLGVFKAFSMIRHQKLLCGLLLLLLALQFFSVAIYRNAFPYFFPFLVAPIMVLSAAGAQILGERTAYRFALCAAMTVAAAMQFAHVAKSDQIAQREILTAVHDIFPQPVSYIDRNGMVSSFSKSGFFMSSWGMEGYASSNRSKITEAIELDKPPLLILNSPVLAHAVGQLDDYSGVPLLPQDIASLRENYIKHWGRVWVAGKQVETIEGGSMITIAIPGKYTWESDKAVVIDDHIVPPGGIMILSLGEHHLESEAPVTGLLRWGDNLAVPQNEPGSSQIFYPL